MPFINVVMTSSKYEEIACDSLTKTWLENKNSREKIRTKIIIPNFLWPNYNHHATVGAALAPVFCARQTKKCRCESMKK